MIFKKFIQKVRGNRNIVAGGDVTIHHPVPPELLAKYAEELGETKQIIKGFLGTLLKEKVPPEQWDAKLREIAATHKELLARLATVQSEDPEVQRLKQEAGQAIKAHEYAQAEELLNQAEVLDLKAIEQMEKTAKQRRISAAATNVDQAKLQRVQLRYAKAAEYWQKAAALLPKGEKKDRSLYLHKAAFDLKRISRYSEALPLYEQSLAIIRQEIGDRVGEGAILNNISQIYHDQGDIDTAFTYLEQSLAINQEIGDRAGEGSTLNNISQIYDARGDYDTALKYLEQSLAIRQEIGDRAGEGTTLNNLATTAYAKGDYATALKYLKQSLAIRQEIGDRAIEGTTLNNIGEIYRARGDYDTALKYLEQSLEIMREIGEKMEEAIISWNIGMIYKKQGDLAKAEQYMARTVEIDEAIGHPDMESDREALEELRAALPQ